MYTLKAENFRELEKISLLSFDEMNVNEHVCYNSSDDIILGPTVMLRW